MRSAGSTPADEIHHNVIDALAEIDVDIRREFPKPLTDEVVRAADVVVTMGCGDACPVYPGKHYEDWDIADPAGQIDGSRSSDPGRDSGPGRGADRPWHREPELQETLPPKDEETVRWTDRVSP